MKSARNFVSPCEGNPMGIIRMHNMLFFGYHGTSKAEKELAKRYSVDVEIEYDTSKAAATDKLSDAINYETIYWLIARFFDENRFHLTETVAERLADLIMKETPMARHLVVKVRKNHPPFPGFLEWVEVECERKR